VITGRAETEREGRVADALLVIDVQNDFCPGGALAVPEGDRVVPIINRLTPGFGLVVLTQDWHPAGHASFASSHPGRRPLEEIELPYGRQVLWPDHCVPGTLGADLHPDLDTRSAALILRKGTDPSVDSYSAFFENDHATATGLAGYLRGRGVTRVVLAGLATDFCVLYSALDAAALGFDVVVVEDAVRGIDVHGSVARAWASMADAGVERRPSWP
jgi:nicotinamidase-related amidase